MLKTRSLIAAGGLALGMFRLPAIAQTLASQVADGAGIVVESPAKILFRTPVFFPTGVTTVGPVVVESTVNAKGEVTDAHVVTGPEELRRAALASVLNWRFAVDSGRAATLRTTIRFETAPGLAVESDPGCLSGTWAQDQASDWRWKFEAQGDALNISRTDGFVSGSFSRTGTVWTGQLHWGSGETWNNVVLSSTENCREVHTNQVWWFKR